MGINQNLLLRIQAALGTNGAYDEFFHRFMGKDLYVKPLLDLASFKAHGLDSFDDQKRRASSSPRIAHH